MVADYQPSSYHSRGPSADVSPFYFRSSLIMCFCFFFDPHVCPRWMMFGLLRIQRQMVTCRVDEVRGRLKFGRCSMVQAWP